MQSDPSIMFDACQTDDESADEDLATAVCLDVATGQVTFHAAWAVATDASADNARYSLVLALDQSTLERYADLDDRARMRVRVLLHEAAQDLLKRPFRRNGTRRLTVELTDAMLDAALYLQ